MLPASLEEFEAELGELPPLDGLARLGELEAMRRQLDAATAIVLADLDERQVWRENGHASIHGMLRSGLHWSEAEIRSRMKLARLAAEHRSVKEMLWDAMISTANADAIARVHANPRVSDELETVIGNLLTEAERSEHDDFKRIPERWEMLTDPGAVADRHAAHDARDARLTVRNGRGRLVVELGDFESAKLQAILDRFTQAEFETDWAAVVAEHGEAANSRLLARTPAQRRADAVCTVFERAVSTPEGSRPPKPVVHVTVDWESAQEMLIGAGLFPERNVNPFEDPAVLVSQRRCETSDGLLVNPDHVLQMLLEGYVRFVIQNDKGIPIQWGRLRRLFTGAARDAVMTLSRRCIGPGCRTRSGQSQAGHLTSWKAGGATDPDNGAPECAHFNRLKEARGWTTERDFHGHFHTYRPDGTEVI